MMLWIIMFLTVTMFSFITVITLGAIAFRWAYKREEQEQNAWQRAMQTNQKH